MSHVLSATNTGSLPRGGTGRGTQVLLAVPQLMQDPRFVHVGLQIGKLVLNWYADGMVHTGSLDDPHIHPIAVIPPSTADLPYDTKYLAKVSTRQS